MDTKVKEYIDKFPENVREIMININKLVKDLVPKAEECMGYGVPAFKLNGKYLLYYAAFKSHLGIYPSPKTIKKFSKELIGFETSKGTIKFPLNKPMPYGLIKKIVEYDAKILKSVF